MINSFATYKNRKINYANTNIYEKAAHHPDRVLQDHDIFIVIEGEWVIGQDGVDYHLKKGDLIILHAGSHHYGIEKCTPNTKTMFLHMESFHEDSLVSNM